jgi:hypothetical protein
MSGHLVFPLATTIGSSKVRTIDAKPDASMDALKIAQLRRPTNFAVINYDGACKARLAD